MLNIFLGLVLLFVDLFRSEHVCFSSFKMFVMYCILRQEIHGNLIDYKTHWERQRFRTKLGYGADFFNGFEEFSNINFRRYFGQQTENCLLASGAYKKRTPMLWCYQVDIPQSYHVLWRQASHSVLRNRGSVVEMKQEAYLLQVSSHVNHKILGCGRNALAGLLELANLPNRC